MFWKAVLLVVTIGSVLSWYLITQPLFIEPKGVAAAAADPKRLEAHVRALAEDLVPRDWAHPDNLDRAAGYIRQHLEATHAHTREQRYEMNGTTYRNVIAAFGPDTQEVIVVGAHYDAFGTFPGADDNASGVSGLLELARLLDRTLLPVRVELAAFTLEEPTTAAGLGLFRSAHGGSAVHVNSLAERGVSVRLFINLEMIGYFRDDADSQRFPVGLLSLFYPSRGHFIAVVGKIGQGEVVRQVKAALRSASALPAYSLSGSALIEGVDWSDHANYWNAGYPAVMITDTAVYRNGNYHGDRDTPDTLDYTRMADVVSGVLVAVQQTAGGQAMPSRAPANERRQQPAPGRSRLRDRGPLGARGVEEVPAPALEETPTVTPPKLARQGL